MKILNLSIRRFRSLYDVRWEPGDLNIIIGPNGSGKSNLLKGLELLSLAAQGKLGQQIQREGGMESVVWDGQATRIGSTRVEAWLLSDPKLFPQSMSRALPSKIQNPETINFTEPPAKLSDRLYRAKRRQHYKKVVNGSNLFARLDPEIVYNKCPHFQQMMDELPALAQEAGL